MNSFELLTFLDVIRLIPLTIIFLYAGWQDHKTGEVKNKTWLYTLIGCPIMLIQTITLAPNMLPIIILSAIVCIIIAYMLFKINFKIGNLTLKGWGGADTKALIMLAACYPIAPAYLAWIPLFPTLIFGVAALIGSAIMLIKNKTEIRFLPYVALILTLTPLLQIFTQ